MTDKAAPRPVVLCILDGWGHREDCEDNAVCQGRTPHLDRLFKTAPNALIDASEGEVGLPEGQMGNSEVGHMNLGAGRVVLQDLPRIDEAVAGGAFARNPVLQGAIGALRASGGTAHIMGLMSPGGVHSHQDHIAALANTLADEGIPVAVHAFLDGRDTPPRSALDFLADFQAKAPRATIATVSGRYYAMDRDKRWERVEKAHKALTQGIGETADSAAAAVEQSYARDANDEFVLPTTIGGYGGMADGDGLFMANFRADRAREILQALLDPAFDGFDSGAPTAFATAIGMVEYATALNPFLATLFPPQDLTETLGEIVAGSGRRQLRIAETEKYAHVTFFFNGGREDVFEGEERILVPSPKVATYDLQPQMSAPLVTDAVCQRLEKGEHEHVLQIYDAHVRNPESPLIKAMPDVYIDLQNAAAMLMRLELRGVDVGERWQALVEPAGGRIDNHASPFTCAHAAMILAAAGEFARADELVRSMQSFAAEDDGPLGKAVGEAALPSAVASIAHRKGEHEAVLAALMPARPAIPSMGGSHAQRDIFYQLLVDSCVKLGRKQELAEILGEIGTIGFEHVAARTLYADASRLAN